MKSVEDMVDDDNSMTDEEFEQCLKHIAEAEADFDTSDDERERLENRGRE